MVKRLFLINDSSSRYNELIKACFLNESFKEIKLSNETEEKEIVKNINAFPFDKVFAFFSPIPLFNLCRYLKKERVFDFRLIVLDESNSLEIKKLRNYSFAYIDCSNIDCKELNEKVDACIKENELIVSFSSFGYKYEIPADADLIFDCRNIPNPYWEKGLKEKTGLDEEVISFLESKESVKEFSSYLFNYLDYFLKEASKEERKFLSIYFGCTGGQHRSVFFATQAYMRYKSKYRCLISHKELKRQ
ncbi:MAG TPA: hypothetical protein DEF61_00065 [Firmicutes bacterium]|nr:hypothetical protein [Bacillota bacterium]HBX24688.1 hypothetical protein [Bacillota bacterium]